MFDIGPALNANLLLKLKCSFGDIHTNKMRNNPKLNRINVYIFFTNRIRHLFYFFKIEKILSSVMCKMRQQKINLILGFLVLCVAVYVAYKLFSDKPIEIDVKLEEYYSDMGDMSCEELQQEYCKLMKSGRVNNLGDGGRAVLYNAMMKCGKDANMDVSSCYPSWTTRIGGTHGYLYPDISTLEPQPEVIIPSAPQKIGTSASSSSAISMPPPSPAPLPSSLPVPVAPPMPAPLPTSSGVPVPIPPPLAPVVPTAPPAPTGLKVESPMGQVLSGVTSFDKSKLKKATSEKPSVPSSGNDLMSSLQSKLASRRGSMTSNKTEDDWETYRYLY